MEKQVIISVGREFGSGGHVIAEELSRRFQIPLYDQNLLECVAGEKGVGNDALSKYDERPKNRLFSRTVRGHSNSLQEHVANMQFDYLRRMAEEGKSFVIVGRCAETKLKEFPALISIFVLGDYEAKKERIMEKYELPEDEAKLMMQREDWKRKYYHNYYSDKKWGDSRNYDISINSSKLGLMCTVDILEQFVLERIREFK